MAAHIRSMRFCFVSNNPWKYSRQNAPMVNKLRCMCQTAMTHNHQYDIDPSVGEALKQEKVSHRNHPGVVHIPRVELPQRLQNVIHKMIERYPTKDLRSQSDRLVSYLWSRHRPIEDEEITYKAQKVQVELVESENIDETNMSSEELQRHQQRFKDKVIKTLRKSTYNWKPMKYDAYKGFLYLVGRIDSDFTVLKKLFHEIRKRQPEFQPKTMFDFGSGVGSSIWAINDVWQEGEVKEHYCVDSSQDMNTIARLLLQDGEEDKDMCFPGVYFRQFMPQLGQNQYNLVVSAFSLLELPSQADRLNTLVNLWTKTEDFLVIVENGTRAGYKTIMEARNFLLQLAENQSLQLSEEDRQSLQGHVFAPCPHDLICPKLDKVQNMCNFPVTYKPLGLSPTQKMDMTAVAKYSYVILKKGKREGPSWSRIIQSVSIPSKHVNCRTCTAAGKLEHNIFTAKKHGRDLYRCSRNSRWGDLLPVIARQKEPSLSQDVNAKQNHPGAETIKHKISHIELTVESEQFQGAQAIEETETVATLGSDAESGNESQNESNTKQNIIIGRTDPDPLIQ